MKIMFSFYGRLFSVLETQLGNIVVHQVDVDAPSVVIIHYKDDLTAAFRQVEGMKLLDIDQFILIDKGNDGWKPVRVLKHKVCGFYLVLNDENGYVTSIDSGDGRVACFASLAEVRNLIGKTRAAPTKTRSRGDKAKEKAAAALVGKQAKAPKQSRSEGRKVKKAA